MTDVLVARGGFADDTALLRLHHAAGLAVRTVESDLPGLRDEQIESPRRTRPACIVFAAGDARHVVSDEVLAALPRLTFAHTDVAFVAVLDAVEVDRAARGSGAPLGASAPTPVVVPSSRFAGARSATASAARVALLEAGADEVVSFALPPAELAARVGAVIRRVRKARLRHDAPRGVRHIGCPVHAGRERGGWPHVTAGLPLNASLPGVPPAALCGPAPSRPWVDPSRRELVGVRGRVPLTAKEATLMGVLASRDRVVAREELGALLWTGTWSGSAKAIDMHVANLRRKLGVVSGLGWRIGTVRGVGFVLEASPASGERTREVGAHEPSRFGVEAR